MHESDCKGMHINYLRAHGFRVMEPIPAGDEAGVGDGEGAGDGVVAAA